MDDEKLCLISIGVVLVMVIILAGWTYVDEEGWPWQDDVVEEDILFVEEGDEVSIDYTGFFVGSDGGLGPVFDTSLPEIARNDSFPKTLSFQERPTYDDLTFTVGSGQMIKGFDNSVRGKKEGDSFTVSIPKEDAYGDAYPERIYTLNSTQTIPLRETMSREEFELNFQNVPVISSTSFVHPFWGWTVEIIDEDIEEVTIFNNPIYGKDYLGFLWNTTVVDISSERNTITLQHQTQEIDQKLPVQFGIMTSYDPDWGLKAQAVKQEEPPQEGFITSIGGQIIIDFNREVQGKTLIFQITINSIKRS